MEALSRMLSTTVNKRLLPGFSVESRNKDGLILSHLLFTDDTLIFCKANLNRLRYLRCLFLCLEDVSGLKINFVKSELVHVGYVKDVEGLACILGWGFLLYL